MPKKIYVVRLDKNLLEALKKCSKESNMSKSKIVRVALAHFIDYKECPTCNRKL